MSSDLVGRSETPAPGDPNGRQESEDRHPAIDRALGLVQGLANSRGIEEVRAPLVDKFTKLFLGRAAVALLDERSPEKLARMCVDSFFFLDRSRPERVDVEVLNPEVENAGWDEPVTVVRTNVSERPFIVDTIREFLSSYQDQHYQDLQIGHFVYPLIRVERDQDGKITDLFPPDHEGSTESMVHAEMKRVTKPDTLQALQEGTERRLSDVVKATDDFELMVDKIGDVVAELGLRIRDVRERRDEFREIQAFLRWLRDGGFVFLGYRSYDFLPYKNGEEAELAVQVEAGSGLGILQDESRSTYVEPVPLSEVGDEMRERALSGPLLIINKTNAESTVHRLVQMDYIGVKKLRADGRIVGEHRFLGLFTSQAYGEQAQEIPILRRKLEAVLENAGVAEGSHDYKEIITIFGKLPKEALFLASEEAIERDVRTILTRYNTEVVFVSLRYDALGRGMLVMVILPRKRFSGGFRRDFGEHLVNHYGAKVLNYNLALGGGDQALLHFHLGGKKEVLDKIDRTELEATVTELTRSWLDEVRENLAKVCEPEETHRLASYYGNAFAPEYKAANDPEVAVRDIMELEAMRTEDRRESVLFFDDGGEAGGCDLKFYIRGQQIILSDFMPVLENCGLRVIAVSPFDVRPQDAATDEAAVIYSFDVQASDGSKLDVEGRGDVLAEAILAVRAGDATNDAFNRLVQRIGMAWREVEVLRACSQFAFQIGAVPGQQTLISAFETHPGAGQLLFRLFHIRFDPEGDSDLAKREAEAERIRREFTYRLTQVRSLAYDRALRAFRIVIDAMVRTNYFRTGGRSPTQHSGGVPYTSFKFDCERLQSVSKSRLLYEVWVRSSRMEGIHLRGAAVARGGIRHSDRPDDFRTEILGLVYTQVVKNAVIVPSGSKGGFVCLRSSSDRQEMAEEARAQYRTLMRGLLDITDNLDSEPPERVVCYDSFDPYLVVAADKGTAPFSDMANQVAADYGFWLDDAFASGGSNGYDHKKVGITAGGAWESVKRHFREMGKNIQEQPFTVAGIGDMSGDVFGNGMLLSPVIRLVAAFDHRNVFIDPDPDPESSFQERKRLFEMDRSSWEDYDRSKLSPGGMIIDRSAKSVELTDEAWQALGLGDEVVPLDAESLIRAVLSAPVELLWNGGIGTYVKAENETNAEVGDTSNDAVRIDVGDLRAKVVGEGGNLGFTQAARVEYALGGGRINTDALDNSGGVDLSDREVNLKILLNEVVKSGAVSRDERNELLRKLTDTVASFVLEDNESQSWAVSLDEYRARRGVEQFWVLMGELGRIGLLDRDAEGLPSWDSLTARREANQSLTRPELSVLLSYAKLHLKSALLDSDLPDDPAAAAYFYDYFPSEAVELVGRELAAKHRLRREIVASQLTNDLVDVMGATFVVRVARETGQPPEAVARAWLVAAQLTRHRSLLKEMASREAEVSVAVTYRWAMGLARVLERTTRWLLVNCDPEDTTTSLIEGSLLGLEALRKRFHELVAGEDRNTFNSRVGQARGQGVDEAFAHNLVTLGFLDHLLEILRLARTTGADPVQAARVYYWVTDELNMPWMLRSIEEVSGESRWEQRWGLGLSHDLGAIRRNLTADALQNLREDDAGALVDALDSVGNGGQLLIRFHDLVEELRTEGPVTLASLSVAVQTIRHLALRQKT